MRNVLHDRLIRFCGCVSGRIGRSVGSRITGSVGSRVGRSISGIRCFGIQKSNLVCHIIDGRILGGINGIGIALLLGAVVDIAVSIGLNLWRYKISYGTTYYKLSSLMGLSVIACFAASFIEQIYMSYSLMGAITVATSVFAYRQMDKRIDVKNLIKGKIKSKQHAES